MGSFGNSIAIVPVKGRKQFEHEEVAGCLREFLSNSWRERLPKNEYKYASDWLWSGDDSLLTVEVGPAGGTAKQVTLWYYDGGYWASALADHWVRRALVDDKPLVGEFLENAGYTVKPKPWFADSGDGQHFFVDGKRIGYVDDVVFWQYPEPKEGDVAALSPKVKKLAEAVAKGGACMCPYCVKNPRRSR